MHHAAEYECVGTPNNIVKERIGVFVIREADRFFPRVKQGAAALNKPIPYSRFVPRFNVGHGVTPRHHVANACASPLRPRYCNNFSGVKAL